MRDEHEFGDRSCSAHDMFIRLEDLNFKNCAVQRVRFVKSVTRRAKTANVWIAGTEPIVEAHIHAFQWRTSRRAKKSNWGSQQGNCYGYCSASHHRIFIKNEKMFEIVKSKTREFSNPWLLRHIMRNVFKDQK